MSNALGSILAPILGGLFADLYGFRSAIDILAFIALVYGTLFFIFHVIPFAINQRKKTKKLKLIEDLANHSAQFIQDEKERTYIE